MPAQEIGRGHTERRPGVEDSSGEKRVKTERCLAERQGDEDRSEERRAKAKADKMAVKFQNFQKILLIKLSKGFKMLHSLVQQLYKAVIFLFKWII